MVKLIKDARRASRIFGETLLLLGRLYLKVPMLTALAEEKLITVVTKAKLNCKAYYHPESKTGRRARPKKGKAVKVVSLFESKAASFTTAKVMLYRQKKEVSYYSENLLWGDKWYQNLNFVLVWLEGTKTILVSTDLTLAPTVIMEAYCHRFKTECAFRELKQVIAGFCYRFWSKHMPKLNRFKPNGYHQGQQAAVEGGSKRRCIVKRAEAINALRDGLHCFRSFTNCFNLVC